MAKATVSRRVFRKCPGQVRATLRPNPLAMVSKKARGTCNLANKDGVSLSGYYSWAAPSRCFAGGVAGEILDGVAATGRRTMGGCVVGALGLGRRLTVVCCSGSNRKGGGMEDYKAVSSESRKSAGRQAGSWSKECGRWAAGKRGRSVGWCW